MGREENNHHEVARIGKSLPYIVLGGVVAYAALGLGFWQHFKQDGKEYEENPAMIESVEERESHEKVRRNGLLIIIGAGAGLGSGVALGGYLMLRNMMKRLSD